MGDIIIKNIPNAVTISRIIASALAGVTFVSGNFGLSVGLYIYAALSDAIDGFLARKLNAYSELGRKLDTISDKLFVGSLVVPSLCLGNILMLIPLIYEAVISFHNLKGTKEVKRVVTERIGKFKTALLFPTLILGLIACKMPVAYFLLIPLLLGTINLQNKTLKSYQKQVEERKKGEYIEKDVSKVYDKKISLKDNLISLRNELISYMYYEDYENSKNNVKRKELKKW